MAETKPRKRRKVSRRVPTQQLNTEISDAPVAEVAGAPAPPEGDRVSALESAVAALTELVKVSLEGKPAPELPRYKSPDDKVAAFKQAMHGATGDEVSSSRRVKDLLHPNAQATGFQNGDFVVLLETSPSYKGYLLDDNDEPIPCRQGEPVREGGKPQVGVVVNYMYTNKKGLRKYKVYFQKFSQTSRGTGFLENELCLI